MINLRSPYWVVKQATNLTQVDLDIDVRDSSTQHNTVATAQYNLTAQAVDDPDSSQDYVAFDIAQLMRDYIATEFDGTYTGVGLWVCYQITTYTSGVANTPETIVQETAVDGYYYGNEATQSNVNTPAYADVLQSNNKIVKPASELCRIAVAQENNPTVTFYYRGVETNSSAITSSTSSPANIIRYVDNSGASYPDFADRVDADSGTLETEALQDVFQRYGTLPCDKVIVSTSSNDYYYDVIDEYECRYTPIKLVFVNKFGAYQDLWFFGRHDIILDVERDMIKTARRQVGTANLTSGNTETWLHQKKPTNVTGAESIVLNSDYYPETYNEVFKELMLSERVWMEYEDAIHPINITDSSMTFKQAVNEKLISYQVNAEFAYDKIATD